MLKCVGGRIGGGFRRVDGEEGRGSDGEKLWEDGSSGVVRQQRLRVSPACHFGTKILDDPGHVDFVRPLSAGLINAEHRSCLNLRKLLWQCDGYIYVHHSDIALRS